MGHNNKGKETPTIKGKETTIDRMLTVIPENVREIIDGFHRRYPVIPLAEKDLIIRSRFVVITTTYPENSGIETEYQFSRIGKDTRYSIIGNVREVTIQTPKTKKSLRIGDIKYDIPETPNGVRNRTIYRVTVSNVDFTTLAGYVGKGDIATVCRIAADSKGVKAQADTTFAGETSGK